MRRQGSGDRTPLSRDQVLRAAVAIADAQGIDALSMRALGEAVGVQAMSLYNHVSNKDDILDGIVDLVVQEIEVPPAAGGWRAAMVGRAGSAHRTLLRHPWACGLMMSRVNIGPGMLRYIDATIGCLLDAGFSLELADHARNAIDSHIYGFTLQALHFPLERSRYAEMAAQFLPMLPAERYPSMRALTISVAAGRYDGLHDLGFGLGLLLDGLEALRPLEPDRAGAG